MSNGQNIKKKGQNKPPKSTKEKKQATADLLTSILKMEEEHSDWAEKLRVQIEQMGLENYLVNQTQGVVG